MVKLISITKRPINNASTDTVSARELHTFLTVKSRFNDWMRSRISEYMFVENIDFITLTRNLVSGGKQTEYHISLDMAKELSMVERNKKGKQARQYFIECEKQAKKQAIPTLPNFSNPVEAARAWADEKEKSIQLECKVEELEPKAKFHDVVSIKDGSVTLSEAAKILNTGRNRLCQFLRNNRWLRRNNEPYQDKIEQGLLDVKLAKWEHPESGLQQSVTALVTGKGLTRLASIVNA